jgi:hypothetical protein
MANGEEFATQVPEVPIGAIGATIDNEEPSKARKFFTDPKNLATMLVLASALAQPRRGGRSPLAHGLRGGVGALAFRGGLDKAIHEQSQEDAEQLSVATSRTAAAETATAQVAATTGRTEALEGISGAEIESREGISEAEIAAGKFAKTPPAGGNFLERATLQAQKEYTDAILNWEALGRPGPMPEYGSFLLRAMQGAALIGVGPPGQLDFIPQVELPTGAGDEVVAQPPGPGVETTQIVKPTERDTRPSLISNRTFEKDVRGERVAQANFLKIKNPTLFTRETPDDEVFNTASRVDQQVRAQLETATPDEAKELLKKFVNILPTDTVKALRKIVASGRGFGQTTPTGRGIRN